MENSQTKKLFLQVTKTIEQQVDAELEKLDIDDKEKLREKRLQELKRDAKHQREWREMGHGVYIELAQERDFFGITKKSKDIVCHFYNCDTPRCKIVDGHLKILCKQHMEAQFCKIDVHRCPFLTYRLKIRVIPTVALVHDGKGAGNIVGFTDLGNCDDFSTAMLEWRISQSGAIKYTGDLLQHPDQLKVTMSDFQVLPKKTIKGKYSDSDDDDDED